MLAELINTALILTVEAKINVRSLTCDGDNANCSALKELGCKIFVNKFDDIKNDFPHPILPYNVRILLDPCHMLKLARNALAEYKIFNSTNGTIEWDYIVSLHNIQCQLTFKLKNKLSTQCINWHQNKMKVKYAAHTFSASVANAIEYLKNYNFKEFQNCEATIEFIKTIDWLLILWTQEIR